MKFILSDTSLLAHLTPIVVKPEDLTNKKTPMEDLLDTLAMSLWSEITEEIIKEISSENNFTAEIKAQLKLLSIYLSKIAQKFQHLQDSIFHSLTILFGMCASRPAYIYAAIFGSSSTRIFL